MKIYPKVDIKAEQSSPVDTDTIWVLKEKILGIWTKSSFSREFPTPSWPFELSPHIKISEHFIKILNLTDLFVNEENSLNGS